MMTISILAIIAMLATAETTGTQTATQPPAAASGVTGTAVNAGQPAAKAAGKRNAGADDNVKAKQSPKTTSDSAHAKVEKREKGELTVANPGTSAHTTTGNSTATTTDQFESDTFGTGNETEAGAHLQQPGRESEKVTARWPFEYMKRNFAPAAAALNLLLIALVITAFLFMKRDTQEALKKIERGLAQLAKADPNVAVRAELANLRKSVEELSHGASNREPHMPRADLYGTTNDLRGDESLFVKRQPQPKFPVLITDYLSQQAANCVRVKATQLDGELFARDGEGEFYLVDDPDGALYVVPAHENITTAFFKTYYRSSYDCNSPGAGDLYLVQPAEVSAKGDLWRLTSKGKLEVRSS
jgi:hypothetical protein